MSIYHFGQMKVISRGKGRSAVAASAYISGEKLYNEYDGMTHDYTRKQGVVFGEIMLCDNAPVEWKNRQALWNEVEKMEKSKSSQLARSFDLGLQTEFTLEENIKLIREYVKNNFVSQGMCADICIHDKNDGNPHAHIMLTMRKVDEHGKFLPKAEKQYLCRNDKGEERYFNSKDLKENIEFEKIYKCKCKDDYKELTNSELRKDQYKNYKKISKYPVDRKIDICSDWNNNNNVEVWRKNWAKVNNELFQERGLDIKIDNRSYEKQGIRIIPTIHEGYGARIRAKQGKECDRINININIKSINERIKECDADIHKLKNEIAKLNKQMEIVDKAEHGEINDIGITAASNLSDESDNNMRTVLEKIKEKVSDRLNKELKVDEALKYIDERKIKTEADIKAVREQLIEGTCNYDNKINDISNYLESMDMLYDRLVIKKKEINSLEKEVSELGIFKHRHKKELNEKIHELKSEFDELKESKFFQKDIKYSEKKKELEEDIEKCRTILRNYDKEQMILYNIGFLYENKDRLIDDVSRGKDRNINMNQARKHSNDLEL